MEVAEANGVQKSSTSMSENSSEVNQIFNKKKWFEVEIVKVSDKIWQKKEENL